MQPKLIITFGRLSEADFQAKAGFIIASLTNNPHFPEPWPKQAPTLAQLSDALAAYREAYHASLTRDTLKIKQREAAREALVNLLRLLASYLEFAAAGDVSILATTGYDLRNDIVRGVNSGILPAPSNFRVLHGKQSGTVDIHVDRLPGAASYEVQIAQGDPTVEANWKPARIAKTGSHIAVDNLTPGQTYWFRVRAIGKDGNGLWTDPVSIIVV